MADDPQDLLRLADRVAAATGPDRELDIAIAIAVGAVPADYERGSLHGEPLMYFWHKADSHAPLRSPERYTASLDAAMTLVLPNHTVQLSDWDHPILREKGPWQAIVLPLGARGAMQQFTFTNRCDHAATAATALTAAALRARAHSTKDSSNG